MGDWKRRFCRTGDAGAKTRLIIVQSKKELLALYLQ
jgi:hypothetical protein